MCTFVSSFFTPLIPTTEHLHIISREDSSHAASPGPYHKARIVELMDENQQLREEYYCLIRKSNDLLAQRLKDLDVRKAARKEAYKKVSERLEVAGEWKSVLSSNQAMIKQTKDLKNEINDLKAKLAEATKGHL